MVYLSLTPFVETLRVYDQPNGYEQRIPYIAILTVTYITSDTVYISGAVGKITRESWDEAMKLLKSKGVTTMMYERRGKMKTRKI